MADILTDDEINALLAVLNEYDDGLTAARPKMKPWILSQTEMKEIADLLKEWSKERHLTPEMQRKNYVANILEELTEYVRAKDDLERVDALADIAVFTFNANPSYSPLHMFITDGAGKNSPEKRIMKQLINTIHYYNSIAAICFYHIYLLGFDPYLVMIEVIKEISSRTGKYSEEIGKFVKDKGTYNIDEFLNEQQMIGYKVREQDNKYIIDIQRTDAVIETIILTKWYKANFENCKIKGAE